tara:strand:+ start:19 stop:123 length:105 start_codon:yes stop_codon:yes gene_type:complete
VLEQEQGLGQELGLGLVRALEQGRGLALRVLALA